MKPTPTTTPKVPASLESVADELAAVMAAYTQAYESLTGLGLEQREAIRRADGADVERVAVAQAARLTDVAALDRRRDALIVSAAATLPSLKGTGQVTLSRIAEALPVRRGAELREQAARVRVLVRRWGELAASLAEASRRLTSHFEGVLRQVSMQISHTGTYSRRGYVEAGAPVLSGLDLRT